MPPEIVNPANLPLQGPDDFTAAEKAAAAVRAEAQLLAEVNDGNPLKSSDVEEIHRKAVLCYASYELFVGPEAPTAARGGDFSSGSGEELLTVAQEMKAMYDETVAAIEEADGDESADSTDLIFSG